MNGLIWYLIVDSLLEGIDARIGRSFIDGYAVGRKITRMECIVSGVVSPHIVCMVGEIIRLGDGYVVVFGDWKYLDSELPNGNYNYKYNYTWWIAYDDISSVVWG